MNAKEQSTKPASAATPRAPVSVYLAPDKANGLHAAGRYAIGVRHDKVSADIADQLVQRYGFERVAADFIPSKKEG
ncbi:MAG TPA: hypothetical protein PLR28_03840 [Dokdonella sp.]|nr:hypothetical protein [Dokdonella sp.]